MAWFKSNKEEIRISNILKGTSDPTSYIGDNGQLYLKYAEYDKHYFMNDTIVIVENKNDSTDIKMYIDGLTKDSTSMAITDADLLVYFSDITSGYLKGCSTYDTSTSTSQTGILAVGNWGSGIVINTYIPGWTQYKSGTFYGVLDLTGEPESTQQTAPDYQNNPFVDPDTIIDGGILDSFAKVNNAWQNLIGTNIDAILAGGSKYIKATGSFTSGTASQQKVEVNCGFKPDLVMVDMEFGNGYTRATYVSTSSFESTDHPTSVWDLRPIENVIYAITPESETGETGITDLTDTGFKYRVNGYNTFGKACTYTAIKFDVEEQSSIAFEEYFTTDTGILLPLERKPSTDKIEIEFYNVTTKTYSGIVGNSNSSGTNAIPLWINNNNRLQFYSYAINDYTLTTGAHKFTYDPTDSSINIDDTEIGSGLVITSDSGGYYALGASMPISNSVATNMYIGRFKVTDISTGNVRCDYTPCIKNGISYIYDYVTKLLLGSNRIASVNITSGKRVFLVTKSTGGYDAAITVSLYRGDTLIETHDVLYTDVPDLNSAYELGCIKLYYAGTWQLRASKICAWANTNGNVKPYYPLDNITSWAYSSSVDYEVMFDE